MSEKEGNLKPYKLQNYNSEKNTKNWGTQLLDQIILQGEETSVSDPDPVWYTIDVGPGSGIRIRSRNPDPGSTCFKN